MRILLVEDDAVLRSVMLRSLSDAGHRVDIAASMDEARHWWQRVRTFLTRIQTAGPRIDI